MRKVRRVDATTKSLILARRQFGIRKRRRLPKPLRASFPHAAERLYVRELSSFVKAAKSLTKEIILPRLPFIIADVTATVPSRIRQDDVLDDLSALFVEVRRRLGSIFSDSILSAIASRMGFGVENIIQANANRQRDALKDFGITLGPGTSAVEVRQYLRLRITENVQLIKTLSERHFGKLQTEIMSAITQGKRVEDVESVIDSQFSSMDSNAELIARDQVGKLNGQLTEVTQIGLGITRYRWRGVNDERERSSHRDLEGEEFSWGSPPIVDGEAVHPGEAIQCRCYAEPILDDLLD